MTSPARISARPLSRSLVENSTSFPRIRPRDPELVSPCACQVG